MVDSQRRVAHQSPQAAVALGYFWFFNRHRLVANAPEEEFAAIAQAEAELAGGDT